ncbi:hypothetical protein PFISCL1PPCAC_1141, partial [Pristionchus fissidentatus]
YETREFVNRKRPRLAAHSEAAPIVSERVATPPAPDVILPIKKEVKEEPAEQAIPAEMSAPVADKELVMRMKTLVAEGSFLLEQRK